MLLLMTSTSNILLDCNQEFIYFTDAADLSHKIRDISNDWANYHEIVDRAYQKSLSYTCEKFVEKIRGDK